MRLGIVGGALQGMEAAYLAKKAGYETVVIDRRKSAPAFSLADESMVLDVTKHRDKVKKACAECDAVIPANENLGALVELDRIFHEIGVPFLFDLDAYKLSSSKALSNRYFEKLGVPTPAPWPQCGFPVVVKPSSQSGSVGVMRVSNGEELERGKQRIIALGDEAVIQGFVEGISISIEVIGDGKRAVPLILTEVMIDDDYDCKMVRCPVAGLDREAVESFTHYAKAMAEGLHLRGIMDVEAIVEGGIPKVLEIDARIPSQTPAAVYHATGLNMLELLVKAIADGKLDEHHPIHGGAAIYEHIVVDGRFARSCGEGHISEIRRPRIETGLFGSDEMITDYSPAKRNWRGTMICTGQTPQKAWAKRLRCIENIMRQNGLTGSGSIHLGARY